MLPPMGFVFLSFYITTVCVMVEHASFYVAWGLSPSLVGLAQKTISRTRVPRVSFQRSSFVIAYLVCVTLPRTLSKVCCSSLDF